MNKRGLLATAEAVAAILIIAADQAVKGFAAANIRGREEIVLIDGALRLIYTENRGAAFSILQDRRAFFIVVTVLMLAAIFYLRVSGRVRHTLGRAAATLIIGGALGNFIDRVRFGYVVDMFELMFVKFAIFNVADIFVSAGAVLMCIYILVFYDKEGRAGGHE